MRKLVILGTVGLMMLAWIPAGGAAGSTCVPGDRDSCAVSIGKGTPPSLDLPALRICPFPIHVVVVSNNEHVIHDTFLVDGTEIQQITGWLVLSFTNTSTSKTIVENVSGPQTSISAPDGSGSFEGLGTNWLAFGPRGQANTGEPGLVFTSGHVVVTFDGPVATSFSLDGTQVSGCALLS